jgi:hypothetical protein
MFRWLLHLLESWGRHTIEKGTDESKYVPRYQGRWVNKGKGYHENWVWEDKVVPLRKYWVNVFKQGKDSYAIVVALESSEFALEYVDCNTFKEVERAIEIYRACYQVLGEVSVDKELMSGNPDQQLI